MKKIYAINAADEFHTMIFISEADDCFLGPAAVKMASPVATLVS